MITTADDLHTPGGEGSTMHTINSLRIDNCAVAFIDHQPFVAFPVRSIAPEVLTNNVVGFAKVVQALGVPTVLTTISARGGPLADPLFAELQAVFPGVEAIDRRNTNAWSDPAFVEAIAATGRRKLVMCGLWTEVCLAQTVLSAIRAGYEVYFVSDCSGGLSEEAHQDAKLRMIQAGAVPMTWQAVMAELAPDNSSDEYGRLYSPVAAHGGGVGYAVQYVLAQMGR
jgi:nicotinamidase-related amidase